MSKYGFRFFILSLFVNSVIFAKMEYTSFEIKRINKKLPNFVKCIEYGATEIPGLVESDAVKSDYEDWLNSSRLAAISMKKKLFSNTPLEQYSFNLCSRNSALLHSLLSVDKKNEQEKLSKIGDLLRLNGSVVFSDGQDQDLSLKKETVVISVEIKDSRVSSQELGYVASMMSKLQESREFVNDRYVMKMTVSEE